ncbi:unnamed protein product, partial [Rotaria magnacalcarata]
MLISSTTRRSKGSPSNLYTSMGTFNRAD